MLYIIYPSLCDSKVRAIFYHITMHIWNNVKVRNEARGHFQFKPESNSKSQNKFLFQGKLMEVSSFANIKSF